MIVFPNSEELSSFNRRKFALSINRIACEVTLNGLSVCQEQLPFALLAILVELSFVSAPIVLHFIEVLKIKCFLQLVRMFVIKNALSMEFFIDPHSVVCWFFFGVVENASAIDLIVLELSFIESSICKE